MDHKLFNEDRKNCFLNEKYPNESTRSTNTSILRSVGRFEYELDKDLCSFSYEEIKDLLIGMKKKSLRSMGVAYAIIMQYLDWCCLDKHYSSMNVLKLVNKEDLKKYIHKVAQKNSFISRDQMYDYCNRLHNYVDKALIALLYEGIRGRTKEGFSYEEIRNLKKTDLIPEFNIVNVIKDPDDLIKNPSPRKVQVDQRTMDILIAASKEEYYHKSNGDATDTFSILPLKDTPFIIRSMDVFFSDDDRMTPGNISSRFRNFRSYLNVKFLTPTLIFKSGLLDKCLSMEKELGELKPDHFKQLYRNLELDERNGNSLKEMYDSYKSSLTPK